jgi:hypothetical protein
VSEWLRMSQALHSFTLSHFSWRLINYLLLDALIGGWLVAVRLSGEHACNAVRERERAGY